MMGIVEIKKDKKGQFFWSIKSKKNGEPIAKSSESYATKMAAKKSIEWMKANMAAAEVVEIEAKPVAVKKAAAKKRK